MTGIPQGSILGPLVFLIYVSDIGYTFTGKVLYFVDDTTLYTTNSSIY